MFEDLENELVKKIDELTEKKVGILRIVSNPMHIVPIQAALINILKHNDQRVIYICLGLPWNASKWYISHNIANIKAEEILLEQTEVIDAVTPTMGAYKRMAGNFDPNVVPLEKPFNLTELLKLLYRKIQKKDTSDHMEYVVSVDELIKKKDKGFQGCFIIIDDISKLYMKFKTEQITKFVTYLRSIIERVPNTYAILLQPNLDKRSRIENLEKMCDSNLKLKKWME